MGTEKPLAYYEASEIEKLYYASRMPVDYWASYPMPIPSDFSTKADNKMVSITAKVQNEWIEKLKTDSLELKRNYILCAASYPTDEAAMRFACGIAKSAIDRIYTENEISNVEIVSSAELENMKSERLDLLVIYNVIPEIDYPRLMTIRDTLAYYDTAFRIVVLASQDPAFFFRYRLKMKLNGAFYFTREFKATTI